MPNPVVHFEIRGRDAAQLQRFYREAFDWDIFVLQGGYALVETTSHDHDESGTTTYTGADVHMNEGVQIGSAWSQPAWRFAGEQHWRSFMPGIGGGIGSGAPGVSFSIQVPDLRAALDRVVGLGGKVVREIETVAEGVVVAAFADPEGNEIGLVQA